MAKRKGGNEKKISPSQFLADLDKKKNKENGDSDQVNYNMDTGIPDPDLLSEWYDHIEHIYIEIFVISVLAGRTCRFCEDFKKDNQQRAWLNKLHILLNLHEDQIEVVFRPTDWNCLDTIEYADRNGVFRTAPVQLSKAGDAYTEAYGMEIEHYPAIYIELKSSKIDNKENYEEYIFDGISEPVKRPRIYHFGKKRYKFAVVQPEVNILRPLLRFLKNLDEKEFDTHSKVDAEGKLGQYHRFTDVSLVDY